MGLFSITKKPEEKRPEMPRMPSFPDLGKLDAKDMPEFPAYEPTISEIKKEVVKTEDFDIPVREKKDAGKTMFAAQAKVEKVDVAPVAKAFPSHEEKTLFVKIEKYKEAMHDVENLKVKLAEAEKILGNLQELKAEEETKLQKWNSEIQDIKDKLLSLDKNLFEQ